MIYNFMFYQEYINYSEVKVKRFFCLVLKSTTSASRINSQKHSLERKLTTLSVALVRCAYTYADVDTHTHACKESERGRRVYTTMAFCETRYRQVHFGKGWAR